MKNEKLKRGKCAEPMLRKNTVASWWLWRFCIGMAGSENAQASNRTPLIILGICVGVAVAPFLFYFLVTLGLRAHSKDDCRLLHLRQIGVRCRMFAMYHEGRFPAKWSELEWSDMGGITNTTWPRLFACPTAGHGAGDWAQVDLWSDYRLMPGLSTNDPPKTILAIEPLSNHETGANVLFVDGSSTWLTREQVLGQKPMPQ